MRYCRIHSAAWFGGQGGGTPPGLGGGGKEVSLAQTPPPHRGSKSELSTFDITLEGLFSTVSKPIFETDFLQDFRDLSD